QAVTDIDLTGVRRVLIDIGLTGVRKTLIAGCAALATLAVLFFIDHGPGPLSHSGDVTSVAVGELDGRPIAVSAGRDRTVRVWDLTTRKQIGNLVVEEEPGEPPSGPDHVTTVAVGELDGQPVAVSGGVDAAVRIWDLRTRKQIGAKLTGHEHVVASVAIAELDGRPVVISSSGDGTIRFWDPSTGKRAGAPLVSEGGTITSFVLTEYDGDPALVSAHHDGAIRLWDLTTRKQIGKMTGHHMALSVALGEFDGRTVVVSSGLDGTIRLWDLSAREQIGDPIPAHDRAGGPLAVARANGRQIIVSGGFDRTMRLWDLP